MKKAIKLTFVAALIALMLSSVVACGGNGDSNGPTPTPGGDSSTTGANFTKPGEEYTFWSYQYTSEQPYSGNTEREQKMNERVLALEDKYGINIKFYTTSDGGSGLATLRAAAFNGVPIVTGMKENGLYSMMGTYLYNNTTGACIEPLSDHEDVYDFRNDNKFNVYSQYDLCEYNSKLWYFIPDEIGIHFETSGNCLLFNKKLVAAAGYDASQIYQWVDNNEWNWEKFETVLKATTDMSKNQWGILRGNSGMFMWSLANGNGTEFVECTTLPNGQKQDSFVYTGDKGERLMEAYDEFLKLAKTLKVMDTTYYISGDFAPGQRFMKGECAFYYTGFSSCCFYKMFDQMEDDYGIIPWPMGDTNYKNEKQYYSMYPHLNPYCVFRNNQPGANIKGAVQMLCELYTPIYDTDSEDAKTLYQSEIDQFSRDDESAKNLDMLEQRKTHFRVFMYSGAPCIIGDAQQIQDVLFGKGEDAILDQTTTAKAYFESIAAAINNAIYKRSPYTWK